MDGGVGEGGRKEGREGGKKEGRREGGGLEEDRREVRNILLRRSAWREVDCLLHRGSQPAALLKVNDGWREGWVGGGKDGWREGWVEGRMGGCVGEWVEGWKHRMVKVVFLTHCVSVQPLSKYPS